MIVYNLDSGAEKYVQKDGVVKVDDNNMALDAFAHNNFNMLIRWSQNHILKSEVRDATLQSMTHYRHGKLSSYTAWDRDGTPAHVIRRNIFTGNQMDMTRLFKGINRVFPGFSYPSSTPVT